MLTRSMVVMLLSLATACATADEITLEPEHPTESGQDPVDVEGVDGVTEEAPDENGDTLFVTDKIHDIALSLPEASMDALRIDPRSYVPATWTHEGETLQVGVRLKGNTSFTWFDEKPALIVDFDFAVPDQRYRGVPSVYLQNMTWDPSMVHEHLAYWFFRQAQVPASRSAYTRLNIDGTSYGLYLLLEKQNSLFRKQWWDDRSGSVYEAGSFNHPCDLSDGSDSDPCTCYEIDRVGEDSFTDLQDLCLAARGLDADWQAAVAERVDWDVFLRAQASEMVVGHYDNYGWNINNYRLYHEPTLGKFYWTPWSTDLAFGWYPWMNGAQCGTYANTPDEYNGGHLIKRCWRDADCASELRDAISVQVDLLESVAMVTELDRVAELIRADQSVDPRSRYTDTEALAELSCVRDYVAGRPAALRDWLARQ